MSGIVLSASVRQNLLSLQSTASLLATTQNALATGNKVNSALDNPTNFFTAQGLNNRASDIGNLLDQIGNGVQVLQAANTGITSLQGYISTAQSIANQVLQAPTGYSAKSQFTVAAGTTANANNLLGTASATSASITEGAFTTLNVSGAGNATAATLTAGTFANLDLSGSGASISFDVNVDGAATATTVTLDAAHLTAFTAAGGTLSGTNGTSPTALTAADVAAVINYQLAGSPATTTASATGPVSVVGGVLQFASSSTGTTSSVAFTNYATAGTVTDTTGLPTADTTKNGTDGSTAATSIAGSGFAALDLSGANTASFTVKIDGTPTSVTLDTAAVTAFTTAGGTLSGTNGTSPTALTAQDVADIINYQIGGSQATITSNPTGPVTVSGGELQIASATTGATSEAAITGYTGSLGTGALGLPTTDTDNKGTAAVTADSVSFSLTVDGGTAANIKIDKAAVDTYNAAHTTGTQLNAASLSASDVATLINSQYDTSSSTTDSIASVVGGNLVLTSTTTGATSSLAVGTVTSSVTAGSTGVTATTSAATGAAGTGLSGQALKIAATNSGTTATDITFGTGAGQVSTLNDLNAKLAANDLQASIDTSGNLTITTTNNASSETIGALTGSGTSFASATVTGPVADPNSQATRASLVAQYNQVLQQINTTAQDSSFNGINLLNGDTLNLTFDETGASKLSISGVTFNTTGLGLSTQTVGTDFLDSNSANSVLATLTQASTTLRTEASALGSNLSVVQLRQDFNKNLINVLQTGASNLTLADTNEEAANSQALSTRQSIAVSALALANQSQQSVLQLLR